MECPNCDRGPLYLVEYADKFYKLPRKLSSARVVVYGLLGNFCAACGEISQDPAQVRENQETIKHAITWDHS